MSPSTNSTSTAINGFVSFSHPFFFFFFFNFCFVCLLRKKKVTIEREMNLIDVSTFGFFFLFLLWLIIWFFVFVFFWLPISFLGNQTRGFSLSFLFLNEYIYIWLIQIHVKKNIFHFLILKKKNYVWCVFESINDV